MNPELIKIALENKEILYSLRSQMLVQNTTVINAPGNTKNSGVIWKLLLVGGVAIISYSIYYNYKSTLKNKINGKFLV